MDNDLLQEFIAESREHLENIEADLLAIEKAGANAPDTLVNKVFRAAHSIKGGSGFFGLTHIKELAHKAENVLDLMRSRQLAPNAEITTILLGAFDKLRELINDTEASKNADTAPQLEALEGIIANTVKGKTAPTKATPPTTAVPTPAPMVEIAPPTLPTPPPPIVTEPANTAPVPVMDTDRPADAKTGEERAVTETAGPQVEGTLRVSVSLLESLMNLAGELVLSRNQLREALSKNDTRTLLASSQRINLVTSELQDAIVQTRMQPIGNVFNRFPRVVRDLAKTLGKEVHLDIKGKDVGLDKTLIEGLVDPLTHMVRNSVDHGVETPDVRARAGKKRMGTIHLDARHEAGQVVIEIADDGKGIDPNRIAAVAISKGLITEERLRGMAAKDKVALIFLPGLSTSETVSDVSGRGVGMDVVKTNLDRLGGKIEIESEVGSGSLFRIKLPLTLAIIPSLILTVEGERFAIPQISVVELLRIRADQVKRRIEIIGDAEVVVLRDQIVPIVRLADVLNMVRTYIDPATGRREIDRRSRVSDRRSPRHSIAEHEAGVPSQAGEQFAARRKLDDRRARTVSDMDIVVVTTGVMKYGLVVDTFRNTEEIVVKSLGRHLKGLQEYAGATIMGDGKVALIIDVGGLAAKASLSPLSGSTRAVEMAEQLEIAKRQDTHSLLLFNNSEDEVCAVPLDSVLRVERIKATQVEKVGGRRTMQYRGSSLSLVTLSDVAQVQPLPERRDMAVIVSNVFGREVGLLGVMPVDVAEFKGTIDMSTHRQRGIAGSTIIRDRTVLLTDLHELVQSVFPDWATPTQAVAPLAQTNQLVLLAEDSDFFRNQVKRYLEEDGFAVVEAPDGQAAWELLQSEGERIRIVVTDIEMPRLSGLGLTEKIRADSRFAGLPIIGLTSLASEDDIAKGKAVGIDDYQIKLDRERLVEAVRTMLASALEKTGTTH